MGFEWLPSKKYKRHYICLNCRKGFKRPAGAELAEPISSNLSSLMEDYYLNSITTDIIDYIQSAHIRLKATCPNCEQLMIHVHYDFEVPRKRDTQSWKVIQQKYSLTSEIVYDTYLHWHQSALERTSANTVEHNLLQINLSRLRAMSKS